MNNQYSKFENKGMKPVGVTDYTNLLSILNRKKRQRSRSPPPPPQKKKEKKYSRNGHKIGGSHFQCVNNHFAKFEYKGMKTVGVTDFTNLTPPKHFGWKKGLSSTPLIEKNLCNVHTIGGSHLQYVNNTYAKFEYKGIKTFLVTDYTI